ncbi:hybrid sensor histidine kinase/response regulator [Tundrisphaera lichenicola]|uniref:hybrid sensor histidine kinase/response regulator n=1 Tax=Tundrisphaera lichenicola TaxID=2029860 RepID=UPI003EC0C6A7
MTNTSSSTLARYGGALLAVILATAVRLVLDPVLGDLFPFATMFLAVLVVAAYAGRGPALLTVGLGAIASVQFLLPPRGRFAVESLEARAGLVLYSAVGLGIAMLGGALRAAWLRAESSSEQDHRRREQLRITLDSIGDAVIVTDASGRVSSMNPVAEALTGWSSGQAIGQPVEVVFDIVSEVTGDKVDSPVGRVLREGVIVGLANHTSLIARDGTRRPIEDSGSPIRSGGEIIGVVLIFRDVTERRRQERELEDRERQFRTLAESVPQLVWMAEPDGHIFWYNRRWYDYTGTTPEQMEGWGWTSVHDPAELPRVIERWGASIATGEPLDMVFPLRDRHGVFRPFLTRVEPVRDEQGRVTRWFGTNTDVTEAKRAEEEVREARSRLESTLAAGEIGTWEYDLVNDVVRADRNLARIYGVTPEGSMEGPVDLYMEIIHPDDRRRVLETVAQAIETGQVYEAEYRLVMPDRSIRWVVARGRVEKDESGRATRLPGVVVDITAQRLAEERERRLAEAAAEANAKFRAFFDQGAIFAAILDLNGVIIETNRLAWAGCGFAREQVIDRPFWEGPWWTPSAGLPERIRAASLQAAGGRIFREELPYFVADGGERIADVIILPIKDESGRVMFLAPTGTDITDRKRAEQALQESEGRFRQVADTMPQIVWVTRPDGFHEYYNRRWYEYIGCTPEECLGHGWNAPLHPDDRQRSIDRWSHSLRTGDPYEIEYRFRSKEGKYRWFLGRALPVRDDSGTIVKWFGTCTDIEDFKRAEADRQKFVTLAENSLDFIGICDLQGIPFYINRAGLEMVGLGGIEEARRATLGDFFFPEDQPWIQDQFIPEVLKEGHGEVEVRFRNFRTGEARWMAYKVLTLADADGRISSLATVSQDVTDRRRLEDDLRTLAADLSEADRRKDEFLATLAHELRNPMAPIRNSLRIMRLAGEDRATVEESRSLIERQVKHMVRLIDDLMDVSRITRDKLELRREMVDLASIIRNAVDTSLPLVEASRHALTLTLPEEPILLDADLTRLSQVFANLLNNAAKYTEPGGEIALIAERQGGEAVVSVIDNGVGIPAEMLPRVFEMFTQVDRTLERSQGGLGIGLMLVRTLVEMHGGSVDVQSEGQGLGCRFVVRLPIVESVPRSREVPEAGPESADPPTARRVLVVDDNRDSARTLVRLLKLMGHQASIAYDGGEALTVADRERPEVILLDIGLPVINGYEVARTIRDRPWGRDVAIVALTGWGQEGDRRRSKEAGIDRHLVKPVDPDALEGLFRQLRPGQDDAPSDKNG